jgi:hypothetical protein
MEFLIKYFQRIFFHPEFKIIFEIKLSCVQIDGD